MGATWSDLLASPSSRSGEAGWWGFAHGPAAGLTPPPADWRGLVAWCQQRPDVLTPWERSFLAALPGFPRLSQRQAEILAAIAAKVQ